MKKDLVSILVPVYNKQLYLNRMLDSLAQQTYKNCEFVFVNDSSSDKSEEIIMDYVLKDNRFILLNNEKNIGPSESRNRLIRYAKGQYICFADADDVLDKDYVFKLLKNAHNADVIMCGATMIDENDNKIKKLADNFEKNGEYSGLDFWKNFQWMLSSALWNKLFKKEYLLARKPSFENIAGPEDLLFNFKNIDSNTKVSYICEPLYFYRIQANSLSKTFGLEEEINDIDVLLRINDSLIKNNFSIFNNIYKIALIKYYKILKNKTMLISCKNKIKFDGFKSEFKRQKRAMKLNLRNHFYILKLKAKIFMSKKLYL